MVAYPKISIVTINLNQVQFIEDTIQSVLHQGYPNLEYIIVDGASNDGSQEIIQKYEDRITYWISEPDEGHYDGLRKGLEHATGDIMGWLNSDDLYHHNALFTVAEIFGEFPDVKWLTGYPTWYSEDGKPLVEMPLNNTISKTGMNNPFFYTKWARWSKYRYYNDDYLAIQQESTFWRRDLWDRAGGYLDTNYKYAFDMELWSRFFRYDQLYTTYALLGGFRVRTDNQKSLDNQSAYQEECKRILVQELDTMPLSVYFVIRLRYFLSLILKPFYYFDIPFARYLYCRLMGLPKLIRYNYGKRRFEKSWF
jgi:glycosyltransferase involved in cell wall biosynthesis